MQTGRRRAGPAVRGLAWRRPSVCPERKKGYAGSECPCLALAEILPSKFRAAVDCDAAALLLPVLQQQPDARVEIPRGRRARSVQTAEAGALRRAVRETVLPKGVPRVRIPRCALTRQQFRCQGVQRRRDAQRAVLRVGGAAARQPRGGPVPEPQPTLPDKRVA